MNIKLEIALLVLGGVLRILGVGCNVWYYFKQTNFIKPWIRDLCGIFLIVPSCVFLVITLVAVSIDIAKCDFSKVLFKLGLGLLIAIGGPVGAPLFVYAVMLSLTDSHTGDFHIIEAIAKATSLVESLFESLPQIAFQVYNNFETNSWDNEMNYIPISMSVLCVLYTIYKVVYSIDKVRQYETAASIKIVPETDMKTSPNNRENFTINVVRDSDNEVYNHDPSY